MTSTQYEVKQTILRVQGVTVKYGKNTILRDLNLEVRNISRPGCAQGQVVALLGPSGMGKSTLFRVLAGLEKPTAGQVLVEESGIPVERGMVGVVAQSYPLFMHRTVLGNLLVAAGGSGLNKEQVKKRADELLKRFDIADHASKYPSQLSGGQRQRVAIAQQFMCSDHFLLMDEPFSGLDPIVLHDVIEFIAEMAQQDELSTFIVVTHDLRAAMQVADTVLLLGRDHADDGTPVPGARIQASYNLAELGLAWRKGITREPEFLKLEEEIVQAFARL